ncbi:glycosyltransferase, group 2 family protein [Propionimicrobium sp. BV2F7]|nr:glycosyltransferase, group 2 family protein [Propionimicrobium sp. BV2F7]
MPKVSIIMPAYNAQETVKRAVRSVFAQDFADWELIIVDDGSTDDTAKILQQLSEELNDERLKLVLNEPNRGPSGARNKGLEIATGEWLTFLDSDDEFTSRRLSSALEKAGPVIDIVVCRHELRQVDESSRIRGIKKSGPINGRDFINAVISEQVTNYSWDKIFRASKAGQVRFRPILRAEDKIHTVECAVYAQKVAFTDYPGIRYYVSPGSLTWGRVSTDEETEHLLSCLADLVSALPESRKTRLALKASRTLTYLSVAHQHLFQKSDPSDLRNNFSFGDVLATARFQPLFAVAGAIFKISPRAYSWLYKNYIGKRYGLQ